MAEDKQFPRAIADLSTEQKFQFEFFCDHCGKGYRTPAKPFLIGKISGAMDAASDILGGVFSKAADWSEQARSTSWERAHDQVKKGSFLELEPGFAQCSHCSDWVCRENCWDVRSNLCKECSPEAEAESVTAGEMESTTTQTGQVAEDEQEQDFVVGHVVPEEKSQPKAARLTCSNCGALLREGARFCPQCGMEVERWAYCMECGTGLPANAKFCPECGSKVVAQ